MNEGTARVVGWVVVGRSGHGFGCKRTRGIDEGLMRGGKQTRRDEYWVFRECVPGGAARKVKSRERYFGEPLNSLTAGPTTFLCLRLSREMRSNKGSG